MAARPLDVHIVGGGLAGLVTGLTLLNGRHRLDARVTIHERAEAPYTTLCGEGLSDDTLRLFSAFDSSPYVAETFEESSWFFPRDVEVRIHQRGHTMARERWIPAMAEAFQRLGGEYRSGAKITVEDAESMAQESDLVVGADGPGSVVRKLVGGGHDTMLGIQYRVARENAGRVPQRLEFYTDKDYSPEYSWIFPRGDILNVGLLATGDGEDWTRLDRFMDAKGVVGRITKREAYPIGFFGNRVQRPRASAPATASPSAAGAVKGGDNVVLVGDAAGLTNPITKGGMAAAIHASDILAECVARGSLHEYGARIAAHPLSHASFAPALDALRRWTNAEYAQLTRFAPRLVHVHPGVNTERRYGARLLLTLAANAGKARDLLTVSRAMGVSRQYSW